VRAGVFLLQVVAIVGAGERDVEFLMDLQQAVVGDALMLQPVGLEFQVIIVLAENLPILTGRLGGTRQILLSDEVRNLAAETA
jgi:hypothetical protein